MLLGLTAQADPGLPWDVVVIDNDPMSARPVFDGVEPMFHGRARLVAEHAPGASNARNRGIAEATGDIVAMIDDDVDPAPDWLRRLVAPIVAGRCDGTCGRVVLDPAIARPRWFDEDELGPYLAAHERASEERAVRADEYIVSSNAAFASSLLRASGGFDPAYGPQQGRWLFNDDVVLGRRFQNAGGRIHHVPEAVVVHELPASRLTRRFLLQRAFAQGRSDWLLLRNEMVRRPLCGALRAIAVFFRVLPRRIRQGLHRPAVAFNAACNAAWSAGAARQALTFLTERHSRSVQ